MDLTSLLLRAGSNRPHVLIVTMPGGTEARLAIERRLRERGWPIAASPADADVLAVSGAPDPAFVDVLATTWHAMPAPRARVTVEAAADATPQLDQACRELADAAAQAAATREQPTASGSGADHGGSDGDMPGGLPMADRGEDRDGLKLDQLHVPLGPVLPDWPAGLVVHTVLQGDVIQQAEVEVLGQPPENGSFWTEPWRRTALGAAVSTREAARRRVGESTDSLGRFLSLAGWHSAAATATRLRDAALAGMPAGQLMPEIQRLATRVSRSRTLMWSTRGLGRLDRNGAITATLGDVTTRYLRWCEGLTEDVALVDDGSPLDASQLAPPPNSTDILAALPGLIEGTELAAARLIIASLAPDTDERAESTAVAHGH